MCAHVTDLPDELLLLAFDRIALSELMRLDRVCHRWAFLLPSACARRRTVTLIIGGHRVDELVFDILFNHTFEMSYHGDGPYFGLPVVERDNSLTLPSLVPNNFGDLVDDPTEDHFTELARLRYARHSGQLVTYFSSLFLNVKNLVVIHPECNGEELRSLVGLVGSFSLVTLKLWLHTDRDDLDDEGDRLVCCTQSAALVQAINRQSTLRELTLDMADNGLGDYEHAIPLGSFSFLAQLKVVRLNFGFESEKTIRHIVGLFENSSQLCHIELDWSGFRKIRLDSVLNPNFVTKVRQFYCVNNGLILDGVAQFGDICQRFRWLTSIRIEMIRTGRTTITFTQLMTNLATLTQLTHLMLKVGRFGIAESALVDRGDEEARIVVSLPQVKILELLFMVRRQNDFALLCPLVFPSAELIILQEVDSLCTTCRDSINNNHLSRQQLAQTCHLQLIDSIKNKFANSSIRLYSSCDFGEWYVHEVRSKDGDLPVTEGGKEVGKEEIV